MRRLEHRGTYPAVGDLPTETRWTQDFRTSELADALRSAMRNEHADASEQEMQEALENVLETMSPAEAFDFGSALSRIGKGANQVLTDPTFNSVARTALPIAGTLAGTYFGMPGAGAALGNLAASALPPPATPAPAAARPPSPAPAAPQPPLPRPTAAAPVPSAVPGAPAQAPAPPPVPPASVLGGSSAAAQGLVLTQQPDVLRSLLATALGWHGTKEVSGIPNAQVLAQLSRLFGQAAADADELMYLEHHGDIAEVATEGTTSAAPRMLYDALLAADNWELAEAAGGEL
jgi:hypothetical protein